MHRAHDMRTPHYRLATSVALLAALAACTETQIPLTAPAASSTPAGVPAVAARAAASPALATSSSSS